MRYLRLERFLKEVFVGGVDAVAIEEVRSHKGTDAAHVYGGILAVISRLCEELKIPYAAIPVGTIKRNATGKGNAGKEAVLGAARERWGHLPETDDEADALWCAESLRLELEIN